MYICIATSWRLDEDDRVGHPLNPPDVMFDLELHYFLQLPKFVVGLPLLFEDSAIVFPFLLSYKQSSNNPNRIILIHCGWVAEGD